MNRKEFRASEEYAKCINKIENYKKGFCFTINFSNIPTRKANALKVVLQDCCDMGLIESISIGLSLTGDFVDETYRRV